MAPLAVPHTHSHILTNIMTNKHNKHDRASTETGGRLEAAYEADIKNGGDCSSLLQELQQIPKDQVASALAAMHRQNKDAHKHDSTLPTMTFENLGGDRYKLGFEGCKR